VYHTVIFSLFLFFFINGCAIKYKKSEKIDFSNRLGLHESEKENGVKSHYGLALSGGGIRSSLFSIGVLKSLYDKGYLKDIDIISSVSGGGYGAYWLYLKELEQLDVSNYKFGDKAFGHNNFTKNSCDIITSGNFVTYGTMFKTILSSSTTLSNMYESQLNRTYANGKNKNISISELNKKNLPYLIMNTTLKLEDKKEYTRPESIIEFTPLLLGNKFKNSYAKAEKNSLNLNKITAISGAAVSNILWLDLLAQRVNRPSELNYIKEDRLNLSDGGKSENLGAISLILRGVKNIIIVDAEHDTKYKFDAYYKLKKELSDLNLNFIVKDIEEYNITKELNTSIHIGSVTSKSNPKDNPLKLNIYYIKMSMPQSIIDKLNKEKISIGKGVLINNDFYSVLNKTKSNNGEWNCNYLPKFTEDELKKLFLYNLNSYYRFSTKKAISFPQYTTFDQSFYLDQSLAFMALGYFQAQELNIKTDKGQQ